MAMLNRKRESQRNSNAIDRSDSGRRKNVVRLFMVSLILLTGTASFSAAKAKTRTPTRKAQQKSCVLHFPRNRSLGILKISSLDGHSQRLHARGDIAVGDGKVTLELAYQDDYDLSALKTLPAEALYGMSFRKLAVSDRELANISHLTGLVDLDLSQTDVGNAGLLQLGKLIHLKKLNLDSTLVTAKGLSGIQSLKELEALNLQCNHVGDAGFESLEHLSGLKKLELAKSNIGDRGVKAISTVKGLTYLDLNFTSVGNIGSSFLSRLKNLSELQIAYTKVNGRGLQYIKQINSLKRIVYSTGQFSQTELKDLKRTFPRCELSEFSSCNDLPLEIFAPLH